MGAFHEDCSLCDGRFYHDFLAECDECNSPVCPGCSRFDEPRTDVLCHECAD